MFSFYVAIFMKESEGENMTFLCRLCETNSANQRKSHIISKFLGIGLFGEKSNRSAYMNRISSRPQKIQDLPKEDFLFCASCEKKFASIESIAAKHLSKKNETELQSNYRTGFSKGLEPKHLSVEEVLLFIYVNFFRLHHANGDGAKNFKLEPIIYGTIKTMLNKCLSEKSSETRELTNTVQFEYVSATVLTTDYRKDETENIFTINLTSDYKTGLLVCSNWIVFLYQVELKSSVPNNLFYKYRLTRDSKKFVFLDKEMWSKSIAILGNGMQTKYGFRTGEKTT